MTQPINKQNYLYIRQLVFNIINIDISLTHQPLQLQQPVYAYNKEMNIKQKLLPKRTLPKKYPGNHTFNYY